MTTPYVENPRIVVSISGIDPLGGFSATREVWPHLQGADLKAALEEAVASCVEQALRQHAEHVDQQGRPGTMYLYGRRSVGT